jgi:hypothetical protein
MQVKPSKPLRPQRPPKELQQQFLRAAQAKQLKPKSFLELHLEITLAAQAIFKQTQLLREATRRLCGK